MLIDLSLRVRVNSVAVVCFPVYKCINDRKDACIVFAGCPDRMIGGNVDDWSCDQGRSRIIDQEVAAVSFSSRSRRF